MALLGFETASKRRKYITVAVLLGVLVLTQIACGGGTVKTTSTTTSPTTVTSASNPTTYNITVTATSGSVVRSTPITLTVN